MRDFTLPLTVTLVLSLVAGGVVVLTRLRLRRSHPGLVLVLHTFVGLAGFVLWLVFLLAPRDADWGSLVGAAGLGCWWVVAVAGIVLLVRWSGRRPQGKRAATIATAADGRTSGPWLSALGHVGVFVAVGWFTLAYVTSKI